MDTTKKSLQQAQNAGQYGTFIKAEDLAKLHKACQEAKEFIEEVDVCNIPIKDDGDITNTVYGILHTAGEVLDRLSSSDIDNLKVSYYES